VEALLFETTLGDLLLALFERATGRALDRDRNGQWRLVSERDLAGTADLVPKGAAVKIPTKEVAA
jgi:hypothetical protein